jgi:putative transposase
VELSRLTLLHPDLSERRLCRLLGINRSTRWRHKTQKSAAVVNLARVRRDKELTERIHELVKRFPTWGYRRIWAWLRHRDKVLVNKKMVHRIVKENAWQVRKQIKTPRPRITSKRSVAT